ncbi:LysR family transcriptional regulator [Frigidibacter sp. MR17.24]|uniref:LysR family transcriptional regulator n=1 Tax=Frigidibacter sp. MR17.24 TaxID=3127345 RepID=UPI003012CBE5
MPRNLDLSALRSFATVAELGGVTRAAGLLNLTQSAVSMQIKRLEESLAVELFNRVQRRLSLTPEGEQLLGYARRMLALNDEVLGRLSCDGFEGEIRLGVPHDIVYPLVPAVLKRLAQEFPRVRVSLVSSFTVRMKEQFARGELDLMLTTEELPGEGAEVLARRTMVWIGAVEGTAWQRRPLRLAFEEACMFRPRAMQALDDAGIPWEMAFSGQSEHVMEATTAADLAITVRMQGAMPTGCAAIESGNALPPLGETKICLYDAGALQGRAVERLKELVRTGYAAGQGGADAAIDVALAS